MQPPFFFFFFSSSFGGSSTFRVDKGCGGTGKMRGVSAMQHNTRTTHHTLHARTWNVLLHEFVHKYLKHLLYIISSLE
jgi:hypothetical protein